ncbi:transcription antitermination factor NusB [Schleiferilactobacillus shenzhenensis]|uniref:Transcription antitermination protein NusB n=1 Tax=Schleiferilactobacillus shenzhenensis LY-73 TaxID=1231336 RepID=U4TQ34_9LACO|nr:transcription antitermination factor NusB [Schleiferilactobacillus shenzhenensis]ERL65560.1 NusB [Schleiferilactobacillus shenzhenensis LY-73]
MIDRHQTRRLAFQTLFNVMFGEEKTVPADVYPTVFELNHVASADVPPYLDELVQGVLDHQADLDTVIEAHLRTNWKINRLERATLVLLRLGTYELNYEPGLATSIILNEMIELAKEFGGNDAPQFVNGLLAAVAKTRDAAQA